MVSEANKHQVDGTHYKTGYEHWDYALDAGLGVLEYAATKHLGRYHKKGEALKDLQKARHYVQKLTENVTVAMLLCPRNRFNYGYLRGVAKRFIEANNVTNPYAISAIMNLTEWQTTKELQGVLTNIDIAASMWIADHPEENSVEYEALTAARDMAAASTAKFIDRIGNAGSVPLEDSNKHADRSDNV